MQCHPWPATSPSSSQPLSNQPCPPVQQLHEVPATRPLPLEAARAVHSYVDELQRVAAEEAPTAVADIGDDGACVFACESN